MIKVLLHRNPNNGLYANTVIEIENPTATFVEIYTSPDVDASSIKFRVGDQISDELADKMAIPLRNEVKVVLSPQIKT